MASTFSTSLKLELMANGENSNTWGTITNTNLGTALEQAIVGKADITMSSTTITLSLTNTNAAQNARAIYLNLTGSPGGAAVLEVPAVQKPYVVKNGSDAQVTIKVTGLTGVVVPVGKTVMVYNNGTDVVTSVDHIPSLTLGAALPVASGGTGITAFGTGVATALGVNTGSAGAFVVNGGALGTPSSGTLTSATGLPIDAGTTGTLPVGRGGTGITAFGTGVATALGVNTGSAGAFVVNGGALGTPSSGTLTSATGLPIDGGTTGTLPVSRGGTGATTLTGVVKGNGTSALTTSNVSLTTEVTGTLPVANGGTGATTLTGVVKGNGTSAFTTSNVSLTTEVTGTLPVGNGGTGATTFSSGQFLKGAGTSAVTTSATVALGSEVSGTLPVANGGTGATSLTANNVLLGNGTSAVQAVAPSTSGNVLTSNGTTWQSTALPANVSSLNGQTGSITNTSVDAIGSYIIALYVNGPHSNTGGPTLSIGSTVAGSTLRYGFSGGNLTLISDIGSTGLFAGNSSTYGGGGTSMSGTWRCMGRPGDTVGDYYYWYAGLFVRVS